MSSFVPTGGLPASEILYRALAERVSTFDGLFVAGVTTTGIFCRPQCLRAHSREVPAVAGKGDEPSGIGHAKVGPSCRTDRIAVTGFAWFLLHSMGCRIVRAMPARRSPTSSHTARGSVFDTSREGTKDPPKGWIS